MSPQDRNVFYGQYPIPAESSNNGEQTYSRRQYTYSESSQQWPTYNNNTVTYPSTFNPYSNATSVPNQYNPGYNAMTISYQGSPMHTGVNEMSHQAPEHHYRALPITNDEQLDQWIVEAVDTLGRRSFICRQPNCGLSHPRRSAAYSHIRREHLGEEKTFECIVCGQHFATENTARRHRDNQERRFTCSYCHRSFARQDYYRTHERRCQEQFI